MQMKSRGLLWNINNSNDCGDRVLTLILEIAKTIVEKQ